MEVSYESATPIVRTSVDACARSPVLHLVTENFFLSRGTLSGFFLITQIGGGSERLLTY